MRELDSWSVHLTCGDLPRPVEVAPFLAGVADEVEAWLEEAGIADGVPFLLSPRWEYDVALNEYFLRPGTAEVPLNTAMNRARALAGFFTFLWRCRRGKGWREAEESDHLAFHHWRRRDEAGPRVAGSTWSCEVSHVHEFYRWAVSQGLVAGSPVPVRPRRQGPPWQGGASKGGDAPATLAHDERRDLVEWLTPTAYRLWRDVGVRGHCPDGGPSAGFRGRWAPRNAAFTDLMVRTGLRLQEQARLLLAECPQTVGSSGFVRFWLPAAVAKWRSARWVYVPHRIVLDLAAYVSVDRAEVVDQAQARGRYALVRRPWVIPDPARPWEAHRVGALSGQPVDVRRFVPAERHRLLRDTGTGLEPAMFWLGESGLPLARSTWKDMFATANARCARQGVQVSCHAHLLRHTFAVVTLEQLQRGHITALADLDPAQRGHYTRIFGDPLDWVRRRLGHSSVTTTAVYLHALQELEMHTRMALVPDGWDALPRSTIVVSTTVRGGRA